MPEILNTHGTAHVVYFLAAMTLLGGVTLLLGMKDTGSRRLGKSGAQRIAGSLKGRMKQMQSLMSIAAGVPFIANARERRIDEEIYESISLLRNIAALNGEHEVGLERISAILAERKGILQKGYMKFLTLLRVGKIQDAAAEFEKEACTEMGKEFAGVLMCWDYSDSAKLSEILATHQKTIRQRRITWQKQRDEAVSELLYLPVILNVFIIFTDFIYVGFFLQQQELLRSIF
ncbi:MAG: hypothetical protein K6F52_01505 [Clostridia bacterium]|nr:hypothetical protein [Clostridia bacterium]